MQKKVKKHFEILYCGRPVGESWAVSAKKAVTNYWWREDKECNVYKNTIFNPSDYEAVEI